MLGESIRMPSLAPHRLRAWPMLIAFPILVLHCEERLQGIQPSYVAPPPGEADDCVTDDDCTLLPPIISCCGECDPVPPFEAVPRSTVDALLLELDTQCAQRTGLCTPPVCESAPPGCFARATCAAGHCHVVDGDCSRLVC